MKIRPLYFAISFISFITIIKSDCNCQSVLKNYTSVDSYNINPKPSINFNGITITPVSYIKNETSDIGLIYTDEYANLIKAYRFTGNDKYVINQIIPSKTGSILLAAEGYSKNNQESFYFIEFLDGKILNSFIFNEGGNELDPFTIVENNDNTITIAGFVKKREPIGSFDFTMFNEDQFMYIATFTKDGKKLWSKGIQFEGYTDNSAIKIISTGNKYYILAYGKKNKVLIPKLIQLNLKGKIEKCLDFNENGNSFMIHNLEFYNNKIWLFGVMEKNNSTEGVISSFDLSLNQLESYKLQLKANILPSSIQFYNNFLYVSSSILEKELSYNNLTIKFNLIDKTYQIQTWGNDKIEKLSSYFNYYSIGTIINPSNKYNNYLRFYKGIEWDKTIINKSSPITLNLMNIKKVTITTRFGVSTINKGVGELKCESYYNKLILLDK